MDTNASGASSDSTPASHEKISAVFHFRESDLLTPAEKVALELAEAMTATPQQVTDDLFKRLQEHYTDAEIVEMAVVIALENFRSRFNRCCGIEAHGFYARLGELIAASASS